MDNYSTSEDEARKQAALSGLATAVPGTFASPTGVSSQFSNPSFVLPKSNPGQDLLSQDVSAVPPPPKKPFEWPSSMFAGNDETTEQMRKRLGIDDFTALRNQKPLAQDEGYLASLRGNSPVPANKPPPVEVKKDLKKKAEEGDFPWQLFSIAAQGVTGQKSPYFDYWQKVRAEHLKNESEKSWDDPNSPESDAARQSAIKLGVNIKPDTTYRQLATPFPMIKDAADNALAQQSLGVKEDIAKLGEEGSNIRHSTPSGQSQETNIRMVGDKLEPTKENQQRMAVVGQAFGKPIDSLTADDLPGASGSRYAQALAGATDQKSQNINQAIEDVRSGLRNQRFGSALTGTELDSSRIAYANAKLTSKESVIEWLKNTNNFFKKVEAIQRAKLSPDAVKEYDSRLARENASIPDVAPLKTSSVTPPATGGAGHPQDSEAVKWAKNEDGQSKNWDAKKAAEILKRNGM